MQMHTACRTPPMLAMAHGVRYDDQYLVKYNGWRIVPCIKVENKRK